MIKKLSLSALAAICVLGAAAQHWALVKVPIAYMRAKPSHSSELVSQAILGNPVKILDKQGDFYNVETPDGYHGLIKFNSLRLLSDAEYESWRESPRELFYATLQPTYRGYQAESAGYATYGAIACPSDSLTGAMTVPFKQWAEQAYAERCPEIVLHRAKEMIGFPYLWGGSTTLAPDCSGFTQTAFLSAGILLPRDAWQQAQAGVPVASLDKALPGDLIFYGRPGKINHVAIYMGEGRIIHSSGHVRICRMNAAAPGDEELYTDKPVAIRRFLGIEEIPGVKVIKDHPFYFKK